MSGFNDYLENPAGEVSPRGVFGRIVRGKDFTEWLFDASCLWLVVRLFFCSALGFDFLREFLPHLFSNRPDLREIIGDKLRSAFFIDVRQ